jgi:hypothetical protein
MREQSVIENPTRVKIAKLTSNILNPLYLILAIIFLLSFLSASSTADAIKWAMLGIGISVLPVFIAIMLFLRHGKLQNFFIDIREQRTKVYLFGCFCAAIASIVLPLMNAPPALVALFVTGLSTTVLFTLINLWWKISLHTALVAASATLLVMLYGWTGAASMALVPLTAWARVELDRHSLKQVVCGAVLACGLMFAVFYPMSGRLSFS